MDIDDFVSDLVEQEKYLREFLYAENSTVSAVLNRYGDRAEILVRAEDTYKSTGHWVREKRFNVDFDDPRKTLDEAWDWIKLQPHKAQRDLQMTIRQLHDIIEDLPEGMTAASEGLWDQIGSMLRAYADELSKNGLPSPETVEDMEP